jgi:hypothetical protein
MMATSELATAAITVSAWRVAGSNATRDETAAHVAESIEAHVDDRLGRAFLPGRDRRVENLVAGAEQRAAKHRLARARDQRAGESRHDQADCPAGGKRQRRRARRQTESQTLERQCTRRRLDDEGQQAHARVVQREEAKQTVAASERLDGLGLEDVVHQRRSDRAEEDERGEARRCGARASTWSPDCGDAGARSGGVRRASAA